MVVSPALSGSGFNDLIMATLGIRRPRNVNWLRAAAILYGDLGTSKAYVVGIAFALAGYYSFWPVMAMCAVTAIVGFNYSRVCKYYPDGGGVYTSAKVHSKKLALVGALLLCADYIVTASLSCLDGFHYLGVPDPERWAILTIFFIGALNFFGPKHSGSMAFLLGVPTVIVLVVLAVSSVPHLGEAVKNIQPVRGGWTHSWTIFVGLMLTLSGIETVSNMTGVMEMDTRGKGEPSINPTLQKTIWPVIIEVCFFTALLALAMNALPGLTLSPPLDQPVHGESRHVLAPDAATNPQNRQLEASMLRYMGEVFVGPWFGWIVSIVFGVLLLSAANTAIVGTVSVLYVMARDQELPWVFTSLNRFGVPWLALLVAWIMPILVLDAISDLEGLAALYAIGVVGAITIFLGSSGCNWKLGMKHWERWLLIGSSVLLGCVWLTIAYTKPHALIFALLVVGIGLLCTTKLVKGPAPAPAMLGALEGSGELPAVLEPVMPTGDTAPAATEGAILVAARGVTDVLKFAIEEAALRRHVLYVLYVRGDRGADSDGIALA